MNSGSLSLGIIGNGRIAGRFVATWKAMSDEERAGADITAVYNPHKDSAAWFADYHDISIHTDDLSSFLSQTDAVYIASPHETHVKYAREALAAGKHVLCEKPMAFSRAEAEELFSMAKEKGLALMEAIKTAYLPGFLTILDTVCSGKIGEIADIEAGFTRLTRTDVRELTDMAYGGSFTEMGSYGLLPVLLLFRSDWRDVILCTRDAANGLDLYAKAIFDYGDRMATVKTGLGVKSEGQLLISGTKGYILAESPWWLTKKFIVRYEDPNRVEEFMFPFDGSGMQYELAVFLNAAKEAEASVCKDRTTNSSRGACLSEERVGTDPKNLMSQFSIAAAAVMERFLEGTSELRSKAREMLEIQRDNVRIWAHRGCSNAFPENTIPAFIAAAELGKGLTGIELDVQFSADGKIVVIHDETVDRVTTATGTVRDKTLDELQELEIKRDSSWEHADSERFNVPVAYASSKKSICADVTSEMMRIPSFEEVLDTLAPYCRNNGLRINVELKTSVVRYEGIERAAWKAVHERGLDRYIVWSSFLADSIRIIKEIDPKAETGMLAGDLEECIRRGDEVYCDAYHPSIGGLACAEASRVRAWREEGRLIRAYNGIEPLYGSGKTMPDVDLRDYTAMGVTDIFTNVPERYVKALCGM